MSYVVAALYRFVSIDDPSGLRGVLTAELAPLDLCGTLLVASEGINGTLAGTPASIDALLAILAARTGLPRADVKFSTAGDRPFKRLKIRVKREIITFGQPAADAGELRGTYVEPEAWNALVDDPEVLVLDTRNRYETLIGHFAGAEDPGIERFTDFADYVRTRLDPARHKKVAMYCTGGIRCEKASAFMRAEGFPEVYHLKGGILKYLEDVPAPDSRWQGECFVFDERVAVGLGLAAGHHSRCVGCGYPLTDEDRTHPHFEDGVCCPHCHDQRDDADKARLRRRLQGLA